MSRLNLRDESRLYQMALGANGVASIAAGDLFVAIASFGLMVVVLVLMRRA